MLFTTISKLIIVRFKFISFLLFSIYFNNLKLCIHFTHTNEMNLDEIRLFIFINILKIQSNIEMISSNNYQKIKR